MSENASLKVRVQKVGTALSNMVMPNIPALIAWGFITALFIPEGFFPNKTIGALVGPMLTYLIPLLIAYTAGKNVYDLRGGVVGATATFGAIIATAGVSLGGLNAKANVPMILGAMILGPLGAWLIKKFDQWVQPRIRTGLEMLVNNFSAGILALILAALSVLFFGPAVEALTQIMANGVHFLVKNGLIPLANIFIEPAKVLFLNNAINHGILTPIATLDVQETGKSLLFLLEANPGPGLGILLAFSFFGKGTAKASAPGAALIHFVGGIHEIYFPYVMMKPALFLAVIAGGVSGTFTNNVLHSGLAAPAAPGSIIAITAQAISNQAGGWLNLLAVYSGVAVAAVVTFLVAMIILKRDKVMSDDDFAASQADVAGAKAVAKGQAETPLAAGDFSGVKHVIFACDAGMGSSAMGASILRDKVKKAGLSQDVTNVAIANLSAGEDTIVVTQKELAARAADKAPDAIRYQVDNFMNSPIYDEVVLSLISGSTGESVEEVKEEVEGHQAIKLDHDLIKVNQSFENKEAAIEYCGQLLVQGGYVNPSYVPAMIERDAELSVYMGNSIAIPHGTEDAKKEVLKTGICIVQVPQGVNFGTDSNPQIATVLFGIAGIGNEHLDLIQKISIFCSDIDNVAKLADAQTSEEIATYFEA